MYETVNLHKLKQYTPNLRVVNLWGIAFITDEHVDSLSANCAKLECMCVNYCHKVISNGRNHRCSNALAGDWHLAEESHLSMQAADNDAVRALSPRQPCHGGGRVGEDANTGSLHLAECNSHVNVQELDISGTELNADCLASMLMRLPHLRWLKSAYLEHFTDDVMIKWLDSNSYSNIKYLDLDSCDQIKEVHALCTFA